MHVNQLPAHSSIVGSAVADVGRLATWLEVAKYGHGEFFLAAEPVDESPLSARIFHTSALAEHEFAFPRPLSSIEVAQELLRFTPEARYPPLPEHRVGWQKGWEIRTANCDQRFIVIALANWVEP